MEGIVAGVQRLRVLDGLGRRSRGHKRRNSVGRLVETLSHRRGMDISLSLELAEKREEGGGRREGGRGMGKQERKKRSERLGLR